MRDVVATLRQQTGVNLVLDLPDLESAGFDPELPVELHLHDVTLDQALSALVDYCSSASGDLDYTASGDAIVVTTRDGLASHVYARLYDARDIQADWLYVAHDAAVDEQETDQGAQGLFNAPAPRPPGPLRPSELDYELKSLLQETVALDFWYEAGGHGRVEVMCGHVLVVAAWTHHRQIDAILRQIRQAPAPGTRVRFTGAPTFSTRGAP